MLLYLQRVCGKERYLERVRTRRLGNHRPRDRTLEVCPDPGIARRETFLERWTAHGVAAAINADPEAAAELAPRFHPNGRLEQDRFVFTETGATVALDPVTLALLARCDGTTPAHSLGANMDTLERLAQQNLILWDMEVPALEPTSFDILLADIARWRDGAGPHAAGWTSFRPLADLPGKFARTVEPLARLAIIDEATERLEKLGAHKVATRFLYSATNPIGEECFRECHFSISEDLINEVAIDAAPWIDLWRDNYAFVASRVAAGLRGLIEQAPRQNGVLPLSAFLRHCAQAQLPLTGPGMIVFAHNAFREVKAAFAENCRPTRKRVRIRALRR